MKLPPHPASSLGAVPARLVATGGGLSTDLGEETPTPSKASDIIRETLEQTATALSSPDKDRLLVQSGRRLSQLLTYRVGGDRPLGEAAHPRNAATHLVPGARALCAAKRQFAADMHPARFNPDETEAHLERLENARALHAAFGSLTTVLDLVVRNEEQWLDQNTRAAYRPVSLQIEDNRPLREALAPMTDYVSLSAQKAARTRAKNAASEDEPVVTPTPAAPTPAPAFVAAPAPAFVATPTASLSASPAPAAPRRARARRSRR